MAFKETPIVDAIERRLKFCQIEWIEKEIFERIVSDSASLVPSCDIFPSINRHVYIGKYLPRQQQQQQQQTLSTNEIIRSETIGQIEKDVNGHWKLVVLYDYGIYEIKADFLVLCIRNPDSYCWIESEYDKIPKYALKAAVDEQLLEFVYIASTIPESAVESWYYSDGWLRYINQESTTEPVIGRLRMNDKALHVVFNGCEVKCTKYKVFCLKPTPSSLKELCRIAIRNYTRNTNVNIKTLNTFIPKILINYLKYPSYLNIGDYLLKGEKLISDDDKYELYIDHDNYLVCKNALNNSRLILYSHSFVDTIWIQRLQTVFFYSHSPKCFLACIFYEYPLLYKFQLCTKQAHPRFLFQVINKITPAVTTSCTNQMQILYNYFSHYDETYSKYFLNNTVN